MRRLLTAGLAFVVIAALAAVAVIRSAADRPDDGGHDIGSPMASLRELLDEAAGHSRPPDKGTAAAFGIGGTITYAVRDSRGREKRAGVIRNTVNNEAKNEVFNRIASGASSTPFDGIAALSVSVGSDDPANGVLAGSIALNLDGDPGTPGNQNPADGTVATDFGTDPGKGTITVTFTAQADSVTVKQIVLTKATEDNTGTSNGTAIADADIFAYVDVPDVTLNTNDTVQYTWTVNVD
jgi:hypothetical protein